MSERASPRVTVAIPTYNRAELLEETLRNVLAQSLQDIEVFVSDNGSTDDTAAVVTSFDDPRVHYAPLERNIGLHGNLSRCLRLGSAPFVAVFPDDDVMDPDNLNRKLGIFEQSPDVDIVHSDYRLVGPDGVAVLQEAMRFVKAAAVRVDPGPVVLERLLTWAYWINPPAALFRRTIIGDEGFRELDGTVAELGLFLRLARRARRVAYIPEPLIARRIHDRADTVQQATHEFQSGAYRPTFAEIGRAVIMKKRFLAEYRSELANFSALRAGSRRADKQLLLRRVVQKSGADRTAISTYRVLREASRVEPTVLLTRGAIRYLLGSVAGPRARKLARYVVGHSPKPQRVESQVGATVSSSDNGRIKILFVSHSPLLYGAERSLYELVKGLDATHLAEPVVVLPGQGPFVSELEDLGIRTRIIPYHPWASRPLPLRRRLGLLRRNVSAVGRFRRLFRETSPALIVTNTVTIPSAALAAYLERIPHFWYAHEYANEAYGVRFHWGYGTSLRVIGLLSDLVLVPSQALRSHLSRWIPKVKLRTLPYAGETPQPKERSAVDRTRRPFRVVVIGHKSKGKRQEDAIRALAILRRKGLDVTLAMVGSGDRDYVAFLRGLAEELDVQSRVQFADFTEDPFAILGSAHVALTCSRMEALPRSVVEGMKYGCAVIGPRSGGTEDLVKDGWNGLLYEPGDTHDLAGKIEALYEYPELAGGLVINAETWARKTFTLEAFANGFVGLASEVIAVRDVSHATMTMPEFSFEGVDADDYAQLRPAYASEAIQWLVGQVGLNSDSLVLDLGAGPGLLARRFVELGIPVVGVEPAPNMRELLAEAVGPGRALEGNAEAIPLQSGLVDCVVAGQVVHWFEPERAIPEIHRVLKRGGALAWLRIEYASGQAPDTLAQVVERHEPDGWFDQCSSPRWNDEFEKSRLFTSPAVRSFPSRHTLRASDIPAWVATWSDVAALPPHVRGPLLAEIEGVVKTLPEVVTFDTETVIHLAYSPTTVDPYPARGRRAVPFLAR